MTSKSAFFFGYGSLVNRMTHGFTPDGWGLLGDNDGEGEEEA